MLECVGESLNFYKIWDSDVTLAMIKWHHLLTKVLLNTTLAIGDGSKKPEMFQSFFHSGCVKKQSLCLSNKTFQLFGFPSIINYFVCYICI